jgi:toxin HigB-1
MIRSFADERTQSVFHGKCPPGFPSDILRVARRKVRMIEAARELRDLESPPGNRLHPLFKDRKGQHAIWINRKYRVCFVWRDGDAYEVEITDYHS